MYGNDNFSSCCLYHPDQTIVYFPASIRIYLAPKETHNYGMTNGSCPLVFVCGNHIEDSNTHIQLFVGLLMILSQI